MAVNVDIGARIILQHFGYVLQHWPELRLNGGLVGGEGNAGRHAQHQIIAFADNVHTGARSEEHTSELQSLMRISYAVCCLKKNTDNAGHSENTGTTARDK